MKIAERDSERAQMREMVRDSAARVAPAAEGPAYARRWRFQSPGFDRTRWKQFCELGWPGLHLPEAQGGVGLGMQELCTIQEILGRALAPEPLMHAAMVARLLTSDVLHSMLGGEWVVLPAWQETPQGLELAVATRLQEGRVSGRKQFVALAGGADAFLVTTAQGPALVDARAPGVTTALQATHDGGEFATVTFEQAAALPLDGDSQRAFDEAALAAAAYLAGIAGRSLEITLDYLRMRKQFGRAIGSFQALQHRAVDLHIQLSLARASVEAAAATLDGEADDSTRAMAVSRAKSRASEAALQITSESIQMHGAIGYTDEFDAGLYLRKAIVVAPQFGTADAHRARYARLAAHQRKREEEMNHD